MAKSSRRHFANAQQRHVQIIQQALDAGHETASGLSQTDFTRSALEQPDTQGIFKLIDAPAQGRLRDAHSVGGPSKTALLDNSTKSLQVVEVEVNGHR